MPPTRPVTKTERCIHAVIKGFVHTLILSGLHSLAARVPQWIEPIEGLRWDFDTVREVSRKYRLDCCPQIYEEPRPCEACGGLSLLAIDCNPTQLCFGCWCESVQQKLERLA